MLRDRAAPLGDRFCDGFRFGCLRDLLDAGAHGADLCAGFADRFLRCVVFADLLDRLFDHRIRTLHDLARLFGGLAFQLTRLFVQGRKLLCVFA